MKVNSEGRFAKTNLIIKVNNLNYTPDQNYLNEKWRNAIENVKELLEKGNADFCYQELYITINDLLLYDIPAHIVLVVEDMLLTHAKKCRKILNDFATLNNINEFFDNFNSFWQKIIENFVLLRKILAKFEKKFFSFQNQNNLINNQ